MSDTPLTSIAPHTFIKGEIHFEGPAQIAGRIEGHIVSHSSVEIAPDGLIDGDIDGSVIDIHGTVKGNINASGDCQLGATARVTGEIRAANLAIAKGAAFAGQVFIGTGSASVDEPEEILSATHEALHTINRIEALAEEMEMVPALQAPISLSVPQAAAAVAAIPAVSAPPSHVAPPPSTPGPTVRVVPQTVQQTISRAPKIIKARGT